jgi:hypothetical protein
MLRERVAVHCVNEASFYRLSSSSIPKIKVMERRRITYALIDKAIRINSYYLDAYWTGAISALAYNDYSKALHYIAEANAILCKSESVEFARFRKFGYDKIGKPQTAWLEVRVLFNNPKTKAKPLSNETIQRLKSSIPWIEHEPYVACRKWLKQVQEYGYTTDEDLPDVDEMERTHFLESIYYKLN